MTRLVRVPEDIAGTHWPCYAEAVDGEEGELMQVSFPCPVCGEGTWTVPVDMAGNEVGSPIVECRAGTACENGYVNGAHADALAKAIEDEKSTFFDGKAR